MIYSTTLLQAAFIAALGVLPAACAKPAGQSDGMSGMQGHSMQGMDMQTMMNRCADMRRQMAQGIHPNTPGMNQMMAHCDEMDHGMDNMPGMGSTAAPDATRLR